MIELSAYAGKKVAVFGLGKAGRATVSALLASGAEVFAWDDRCEGEKNNQGEVSRPSEPAAHLMANSKGFAGGNGKEVHFNDWPWAELECLVLSPGVPFTHPAPHVVVKAAQTHGCPIICDVALLLQSCGEARIIAITGTNGKSTTTALIGHILRACGVPTQVGGNIGTAVLELEKLDKDGVYVLELSSYQLDLLDKPRIDVAVWLNISPDHLDRHGGMEGYVAAKQRIFSGQTKKDSAIICIDDEHSKRVAGSVLSELTAMSTKQELPGGVFVKDGVLHHPQEQFTCDLTGIPSLTGEHNWQNAAAAYAAVYRLGLAPGDIFDAMQTFPGLRHRLQRVAQVGHVWFVNDSKATNAEAASHALASFDNMYWIAGGVPKEGGINALAPYFSRISHAFLIGEAQEAFAKTLEGKVRFTQCNDLETATKAAAQMALADGSKNAVVLLSPACASFDQWASFERRGDAFCDLVDDIAEQKDRYAL